MSVANQEAWWASTSRLMQVALVIWFIAGFGIHFFATSLNSITVFGFPLGFYMAAQGSLIIFVALLFWFASSQDRIDRDHGFSEDA